MKGERGREVARGLLVSCLPTEIRINAQNMLEACTMYCTANSATHSPAIICTPQIVYIIPAHSYLIYCTYLHFYVMYHGRRNSKGTNPLMSSLLVIFVWGGEAIL